MKGLTMSQDDWFAQWLNAVQDGSSTMSQRKRSSVEKNGGLELAVDAAKARSVHLVELTDDHGEVIIAASRHPFNSLC